jgi:malonyl-ACP O-methyltransferase BioC
LILSTIDKKLVSRRFAGSINSYAANAVVQSETAGGLIAALKAACGNRFDEIFEVGCGTGLLTSGIIRELQHQRLTVNDIVPEYRSHIAKIANCEFIEGDIETISGLPLHADLIISNATFQWLANPEAAFARFAGILPSGGVLAFSTFGPENMREIASITGHSLAYPSIARIREMLSANFEVKTISEQSRSLVFSAPQRVLEHLRKTGVTGIKSRIWTKSVLKNFIKGYIDRYSVADGVTLTYHPVLVVAVKR